MEHLWVYTVKIRQLSKLLIILFNMIIPNTLKSTDTSLRKNLDRKIIQLLFVRFEDQLANILTKTVSESNVVNFISFQLKHFIPVKKKIKQRYFYLGLNFNPL